MATSAEVLQYLIPNGGWYISGEEFEGIKFLECEPITKEEFEAGFAKCDAWKKEQEKKEKAEAEAKAQAKAELLQRLGITEDEARLLLA